MNWIWWTIVVAFIAPLVFLLIANRTKIAGWFTVGSWKTTLWWIGGIALLALAAWGIYLENWGAWWNKIAAWPYWLYVLIGVPCLVLLIIGAKNPKPIGDGFKKTVEFLIALAKLAALVALTVVMFIFIVGPRYFWGEPSVVQVQQQPAPQAKVVQTAVYPQSFTVTAPMGSINDPPDKWSAPVRVNGRKFTADAKGTKDTMPMAVWADGMVLVVAPGVHPHIASPREVRFLSLTNVPLEIVGTIE